jgi:orotate phosphoribosyltransferase
MRSLRPASILLGVLADKVTFVASALALAGLVGVSAPAFGILAMCLGVAATAVGGFVAAWHARSRYLPHGLAVGVMAVAISPGRFLVNAQWPPAEAAAQHPLWWALSGCSRLPSSSRFRGRMQNQVSLLLSKREGHFALESGHHGELWLDLELLFLHPERVRPLALALAERLARHGATAVCGPLVEGAFLGLMVASSLGVPFSYAERVAKPSAQGLLPIGYRIPDALRGEVAGQRVAVVNDVINAGSAVLGTLEDLRACGAVPVAVGTLAVLGRPAHDLAAKHGVALETLASFPNPIWEPAACPLCARGVPLAR